VFARGIIIFINLFFLVLGACTKDRLYTPNPPVLSEDTLRPDSGAIFLNEIMASAGGSYPDPADGASDDWFEIYNSGSFPLNLSGWALSDDPADPLKSVLPDNAAELTIPAGGYMVFWADDTPAQGVRHVAFKLSSTNGDKLLLYKPSGNLIDSVSFGPQSQDVSFGRSPDGTNAWRILSNPSPGSKNQ
jgi:hypothetical protein